MSNEQARQKHNELAPELAAMIIREVPHFIEQLIVLESIIVGVIGMQRLKLGGDEHALDLLIEGARPRLRDARLAKIARGR